MIPIGIRHTAKLSGKSLKFVTCEKCRLEYVYVVNGSGVGSDSNILFLNPLAEEKARWEAEADLKRTLAGKIKEVPCPACGQVQENMLALARNRKFGHSLDMAGLAIITGRILAGFAAVMLALHFAEGGRDKLILTPIYGPPALLVFVWGLRKWLRLRPVVRQYDPNSEDLEERLRLGRENAIPRDELVRQIAAMQPKKEDPKQGEPGWG
ncbi:hypothetical protein [Zavarzinella formosa]|uniref:hypothetical protein n=1 Tax=Zavarzinella formosa TaxID=360055 RepID=UPI0002E1C922|nr:hypothetical protein [Zavarzinella formosa]